MKILALDLGEHRTGYVLGEAGTVSPAKLLLLRKTAERTEDAAAALAKFVRNVCEDERPELIVMEHYLRAGAVFDAARQVADVVIIETPPILAYHHAEALAHAEREFASPTVGSLGETDDLEDLVDPVAGDPVRVGEPVQVVACPPPGMSCIRIEQRTDLVQGEAE